MFSSLGLHVIKFPSGRYGFVGSIPTNLGTAVPASRSAVMGQRSFWNEDKTALLEWKFPSFETEQKGASPLAAPKRRLCGESAEPKKHVMQSKASTACSSAA